jgi:sigma-B regulation protein RsbU (phosphoserine phosphatase)
VKLRSSLLLGTLPVIAGALTLAILATGVVLRRAARRGVADELGRTQRVFEEVQSYRRSLIRAEASVIAEEPRLKAVVATEDVSPATLVGVARDLRKLIQSDLFILVDAEGRLRLDLANPDAADAGADMGRVPVVAAALRTGEGSGVWTDDARAYQVEAKRMMFGAQIVGAVITGFALDDGVARAVSQQTAADVVIENDGRLVAAFPRDRYTGAARTLAAVPTDADGVTALEVGGTHMLARAALVPGYAGGQRLRYLVAGSLDAALAPAHRLLGLLVVTLGVALGFGLAWASALTRRLSRPIERLVALTRAIAAGRLDERAPSAKIVEVEALGQAMNRMTDELKQARELAAIKRRLEEELDIAARIQTYILPRSFDIGGLEIAARMLPATEVGGDYFDVIPLPQPSDVCWLGIGDVAGHGLPAGLVMLMVQSATAGLVQAGPRARPSEHLVALNAMVHENVRRRLGQDEHVTFTLFRLEPDGQVTFAGAHEEIVVWRAAERRCERLPTPGPWLGTRDSIVGLAVDSTLRLEPGDMLILYTDGVTEAMNARREQYGLVRLCAEVERMHAEPAAALRDAIIESVNRWQTDQVDDLTLMIVRKR